MGVGRDIFLVLLAVGLALMTSLPGASSASAQVDCSWFGGIVARFECFRKARTLNPEMKIIPVSFWTSNPDHIQAAQRAVGTNTMAVFKFGVRTISARVSAVEASSNGEVRIELEP